MGGGELLALFADHLTMEPLGILLDPLDDRNFTEIMAGFFRLDPLVSLDLFQLSLDELMIGHKSHLAYYPLQPPPLNTHPRHVRKRKMAG